MPWYYRVRTAINAAVPFLVPTQTANLALLVSAILKKQTLCLSELARAYPTPEERRVASPKHDLLHRIKRLWRFIDNERVDALAVQLALVPHTIACLGFPRLLGLAIDWTFFDTTLPSGQRIRYQVLRIAVPRKGRALPLLQLAYDRDNLSPNKSQNQIEQDALLAVLGALPMGVRPVVLADRGFPSGKLHRLAGAPPPPLRGAYQEGRLHNRSFGSSLEAGPGGTQDGRAALHGRGTLRSLYHGRPRDLWINVALCWRISKSRAKNPRREQPEEPWYLATSLKNAKSAASWYWQRGWIEQSFKDSKSRFGLARVRVGCPKRLSRLLMALSLALTWLTLMGLPGGGVVPKGFRAAVVAWGKASVISMALALLEKLGNLPLRCLPQPTVAG